jgi:transcriptional regulator with XRE-family HTH domain
MEASDENLAQFVTRLRSQRYPSRREADRQTGVSYSTWQNIEIRGTLPTIEILTQLATALDVEEVDLVRAAKVTLIQKREN